VAERRIPVRLIVALSVAVVLAVFLLYTSFAGGATPSIRPSQLDDNVGEQVSLAGIVVGPIEGDARGDGLRFMLRDFDGDTLAHVVYTGRVPDLFKETRHVFLEGTFEGSAVIEDSVVTGVFVGKEDSMVTKCPSKYAPAEDGHPES
jgi:cytochrome c-type biogenesis protein CcmE